MKKRSVLILFVFASILISCAPQVTVTSEVTVTSFDKSRTLTNLYNQRPTWLALAHEKLDKAVFAAYGWPHDLSDEEILARLLALNLERAGTGSPAGA